MIISYTNAALVVGFAVLLFVLWRWNHDTRNPYSVRDLLIDPGTGKASLDKHIVLGFAMLSGWVVVSRQLAGKEVETLLLGVLGIFILQRAASKAMDTFAPRDISRDEPTGGKANV